MTTSNIPTQSLIFHPQFIFVPFCGFAVDQCKGEEQLRDLSCKLGLSVRNPENPAVMRFSISSYLSTTSLDCSECCLRMNFRSMPKNRNEEHLGNSYNSSYLLKQSQGMMTFSELASSYMYFWERKIKTFFKQKIRIYYSPSLTCLKSDERKQFPDYPFYKSKLFSKSDLANGKDFWGSYDIPGILQHSFLFPELLGGSQELCSLRFPGTDQKGNIFPFQCSVIDILMLL